jgi:CrcB protein
MMWMYVALGGAIGACMRYSLALALANHVARFPWATFAANGIGCLLMGVGFAFIVEREFVNQELRHFLLVGMMGALTTYSTFAVESLALLQNQNYKIAFLYILGTLVLSIVTCFIGLSLGRWLVH